MGHGLLDYVLGSYFIPGINCFSITHPKIRAQYSNTQRFLKPLPMSRASPPDIHMSAPSQARPKLCSVLSPRSGFSPILCLSPTRMWFLVAPLWGYRFSPDISWLIPLSRRKTTIALARQATRAGTGSCSLVSDERAQPTKVGTRTVASVHNMIWGYHSFMSLCQRERTYIEENPGSIPSSFIYWAPQRGFWH
jgi:hypothetical protein